MSQQIAEKAQQELWSSSENGHDLYLGCFKAKHGAIMKEATELLNGQISEVTCLDSLNCGKLSRLIKYLRHGSTFIIFGTSYVEAVFC